MAEEKIHISLIAAMARNRCIGKDGTLPWRIPEDLRYFKETTMGKPLVMGRKTLESFGGRLLPGRPHFVVSRQADFEVEGLNAFSSVEAALLAAKREARTMGEDEIMVIGGGEIYKQTIDQADRIYLTEVDAVVEGDTFFPDFNPARWKLISDHRGAEASKDTFVYDFCIYDRIN